MAKESDQAIEHLLEERLKVLQWLDRLSSAGNTAPTDVLERVRRDYETRLDGVSRQLEGYQNEIQDTLNLHEHARKELAESERKAQDKLAEAELRHMVGEFEDGRWTGLQAEITTELSSVRKQLNDTESEITRLDEVLGLIKHKPNTEVRKAIPLVEQPPHLVEADPPKPDKKPGLDLLLEPMLDEVAPPPMTEPKPVELKRPTPPEPPTRQMDELAFLKSVTEDEQQGPAPSRASGLHQMPEALPTQAMPAQTPSRSEREGGPKKTLKCGECGVMNFPTEWYCERCGAELAAL